MDILLTDVQKWYASKINKKVEELDSYDLFCAKVAYDYHTEQCNITNVVKSLPIQDLPKCNRVEVIDQQGRTYVNRNPGNKVSLSVQDEGRTLKVFID